jgi:hypothetical protein
MCYILRANKGKPIKLNVMTIEIYTELKRNWRTKLTSIADVNVRSFSK